MLSLNKNAIALLDANFDKIHWYELSTNPNAISLLEANPYKINWSALCKNPNAISLLKANQDKIDWNVIVSKNPSIFAYDYEMMRKTKADLNEEAIAKALHPKRIFRLIEEIGEDEVYNIYFDEY